MSKKAKPPKNKEDEIVHEFIQNMQTVEWGKEFCHTCRPKFFKMHLEDFLQKITKDDTAP